MHSVRRDRAAPPVVPMVGGFWNRRPRHLGYLDRESRNHEALNRTQERPNMNDRRGWHRHLHQPEQAYGRMGGTTDGGPFSISVLFSRY
jgi:hypothetical protein